MEEEKEKEEKAQNIFERVNPLDNIKRKEFSDYTASELCSYILHTYPTDPLGALQVMIDNVEVGLVLGRTAKLLLEGYLDAERKSNKENLS